MGTKFVYVLWFIVLCDPQWWIASFGPTFVRHIPTFLFGITLLLLPLQAPSAWFPPLLTFILYTCVNSFAFAYNRGLSFVVVKLLVAYYVLAIGSLAFVRKARQAVPIVAGVLLWQFVWWVVLGVKNGIVSWHPSLNNYDGYGPLMSIGIGTTYYYGMSTSNRRERWLAFAVSGGCVVGLVSSYARGAVLAGAAVFCWIWLRSKRKGLATLVVVGGVVVVGLTGSFLSGSDRGDADSDFFTEMSTIGSGDGSQNDRSVIWALARKEFYENPVFGVGADGFGPYAAGNFGVGSVGGAYDDNPGTLYGKALHSVYFQILAEYGAVGSAIFVWMVVDFFLRNAALRQRPRIDRWALVSGGRLHLEQLSYALEVGMVGFLAGGLFYNLIFGVHWFYSLLTINTLLSYLSDPAASPGRLATARARR